jgi:hypothetical protein
MNDEEKLEKMYKDLFEKRRELRKEVTWTATQSVKSSQYSNISGGVVNLDFASLYSSTMTMKLSSRKVKRMNKINKIFGL